MQNCGELWGIVEGEIGYFGRICCRIVGNYGRIWGKRERGKGFCRLMFWLECQCLRDFVKQGVGMQKNSSKVFFLVESDSEFLGNSVPFLSNGGGFCLNLQFFVILFWKLNVAVSGIQSKLFCFLECSSQSCVVFIGIH